MATKKKKTKNTKSDLDKVVALGAGVAAVSAAAYVLFGPEGKQNRKKIKGWTVKMKGEVIEKLEVLKKVHEEDFHKVLDQIAKKYAKRKGLTEDEVFREVGKLKKHWKSMKKDLGLDEKAKNVAKKKKTPSKKKPATKKKSVKKTSTKKTKK